MNSQHNAAKRQRPPASATPGKPLVSITPRGYFTSTYCAEIGGKAPILKPNGLSPLDAATVEMLRRPEGLNAVIDVISEPASPL